MTIILSPYEEKTVVELAAKDGVSEQEVVKEALEAYRKSRFFARANETYAMLRRDSQAWAEELEERAEWDRTLLDGLEDGT